MSCPVLVSSAVAMAVTVAAMVGSEVRVKAMKAAKPNCSFYCPLRSTRILFLLHVFVYSHVLCTLLCVLPFPVVVCN